MMRRSTVLSLMFLGLAVVATIAAGLTPTPELTPSGGNRNVDALRSKRLDEITYQLHEYALALKYAEGYGNTRNWNQPEIERAKDRLLEAFDALARAAPMGCTRDSQCPDSEKCVGGNCEQPPAP